MLYPTGIIFKGSGFYRTDSRAGGKASAESTAPTSESTSKSSSDAKPKAASAEGTKGSGDSGT